MADLFSGFPSPEGECAQSPITQFTFGARSVRVLMRGDEPWFVAEDICRALDLHRTAPRRLDEDERGVHSTHTPSTNQHGHNGTQTTSVAVINESGLYSLILGSRKPEAKAFKKWVTSEVLPSIRRSGAYGVSRAAALDGVTSALTKAAESTNQLIAANTLLLQMVSAAVGANSGGCYQRPSGVLTPESFPFAVPESGPLQGDRDIAAENRVRNRAGVRTHPCHQRIFPEDVADMIRAKLTGVTHKELAETYGISRSRVATILIEAGFKTDRAYWERKAAGFKRGGSR
jgi:prophage antirepressor-like protein